MIVHAIKTAPICIKLDNAYAGVSSLGVPPGVPWHPQILIDQLKFIYSEKATNFCEISTINLSYVVTVKSTVEISQSLWPSQNI